MVYPALLGNDRWGLKPLFAPVRTHPIDALVCHNKTRSYKWHYLLAYEPQSEQVWCICCVIFPNLATGWACYIILCGWQYRLRGSKQRQVSNISCTESQQLKDSCTVLRLSLPNPLSQMWSREWRCSWSSAARRCSNYIWVIDNVIAYWGALISEVLRLFSSFCDSICTLKNKTRKARLIPLRLTPNHTIIPVNPITSF